MFGGGGWGIFTGEILPPPPSTEGNMVGQEP